MVRRHSILASIFVADPESGNLIQVVLRDPKPRLVYDRDISREPGELLQEMKRPVFRPGEPEHALTIFEASNGLVTCWLDINHTLIDVASIPILVGDLAKTYRGAELPPAPPFRDLIQYIERTARSEKLAFRLASFLSMRILERMTPMALSRYRPVPLLESMHSAAIEK